MNARGRVPDAEGGPGPAETAPTHDRPAAASGPRARRATTSARPAPPRGAGVPPHRESATQPADLPNPSVAAHIPRAPSPLDDGPLLDLLLASLPVAVVIVDRELRVVRVNDAFVRLEGSSAAVHRGRALAAVLGPRAVLAEADARRVLADGRPLLDRHLQDETADEPGSPRSASVSYVPVTDADGGVAGVLALVVDTTERMRASAARAQAVREARAAQAAAERASEVQALLAEIDREVASTLDAEAGARHAAELLVPRIARRVAVRLKAPDGTEQEVAAAAARPADADAPDLAGVPDPDDATRAPLAELVLPLVASGGPLGTLGTLVAAGRFGPTECALLEAVASRIAIAVETARLHAAERRARAAAEAANAAKSSFLATMSHEIRTPINAIMGYTELLEMGLSGPLSERQCSQLARVRASSVHLLALVNDVLDLAKVEAGRLRVERERASMATSVAGALALVQPQADRRGIHLANLCADTVDARYLGDRQRVEQILVNLLSNAVRFTEPGGRVTVSCETAAEAPAGATLPAGADCLCAVRVEDTGIGIAPAKLDSVFEPFVQVESGHTRTREGSGLGLAISRRLARLMDGDLTATSEVGHGSAFTLTLPGAPAVTVDSTVDGECLMPERRDRTRHARGLFVVGEALARDVDAVVSSYATRLRADPRVPAARRLSDVALRNHTATLIVDYAQALAIIEASEGAPTQLMRDGAEIQRVIADRHGRLRYQLGFSEAELVREFAVLAGAITDAVRALSRGGASAAEALSLLAVFMERACEASVESYRRAGGGVAPHE